jgi:hypothetical protein
MDCDNSAGHPFFSERHHNSLPGTQSISHRRSLMPKGRIRHLVTQKAQITHERCLSRYSSDKETIGHSMTMKEDGAHRLQVRWTVRMSWKARHIGTTDDVRGRYGLIRGLMLRGRILPFSKPCLRRAVRRHHATRCIASQGQTLS